MKENSLYDKKSIRAITGKSADWDEVVKDCIAFSNAQGGTIDYGIEDDMDVPASEQHIDESLIILVENKISQRAMNVNARAEIITHINAGNLFGYIFHAELFQHLQPLGNFSYASVIIVNQ